MPKRVVCLLRQPVTDLNPSRAGSRYWSGTSRGWLKSKNAAFVRE